VTQGQDLESFRANAQAWLASNMSPLAGNPDADGAAAPTSEQVALARRLQRQLYEGGFAGLAFPSEYGGRGLTAEHQRVFNQESAHYEMPLLFNVPTLTIIAPTLLDFGTEEQKRRHLPAILRGDELWVQLLSEPSGGSDLAGVITRATRNDEAWVLNGTKVWSTGAQHCDVALCLARSDWDVPKHQGLTMFIVKMDQPGVVVEPIRTVNETSDFCQEYLDDVVLPADGVLGQPSDGWSVASRLLAYEREAASGGSKFFSGFNKRSGPQEDLLQLARATNQSADRRVRQLVADAHVYDIVQQQLVDHLEQAIQTGRAAPLAGSILRLHGTMRHTRRTDIGFEIAGSGAVAWREGERAAGVPGRAFLWRQAACLAGGSTEMQRNIISERLLGMPREFAEDRERPFRAVRINVGATSDARSPAKKGGSRDE